MTTFKHRPPLLLAIIGLLLYFGLSYAAPLFNKPVSEEEHKLASPAITKREAADTAEAFIRSRFGLSGGQTADTLLQSATARSGYLQQAGLDEQYRQTYAARFPIDYYEVEIRDGASTYYVGINYTNRSVLSFSSHKSPAAKTDVLPAQDMAPEAAAERTLREMGFDPAAFTVRSGVSAEGAAELVYVSKTERIGEAVLELRLRTAGGQVTAFRPTFPPPDSFIRWREAQDERSGLMTRISMLASLAMAFSALVIVLRNRRQIDFARGALLSLVFLAVYVLNNYNMLPAFRTMHGSGPSEPGAIVYLWINNVYVTLMAICTYFALLAGGRLMQSHGVRPWPLWRDEDFGSQAKQSMKDGYIIGLFILGIQQLLFLGASALFDVWAVNDPTDSIHNMLHPEWFPLLAWSAAISEEAIYRLLGVSLMLRLTRSPFISVLVPSIIWAMSHTQYPIYPVYTRLIEVTVIGIIFGYAFLRYGFLTAVFAHAAMDSILMGLSLLYDGNNMQAVAGVAYFLVPAAAGWLLYAAHGKFRRRPPALAPPPFPK
ncbi:Membrane protease YdiL, CAAX protease family [Paenibacillus sp. UNCCL117]|uniref:CPBP family intramembrane glutamic endopeptidase n=1 Tax=unclassified Paenibacillus TaxID=185978 RepID=UPI00088275D3|nr:MULTISPECIES: CPBP family intramembrane glutamic endopeptidase [unclassified Paenibacillus]SDE04254.1 Membrane protease YdiL, CAAX protease family [Paenibacillus sp. cl123]SFW57599.1 Membrane protease YdiL, CAAX protease family [Paenibacillus sp. UNCCL117]